MIDWNATAPKARIEDAARILLSRLASNDAASEGVIEGPGGSSLGEKERIARLKDHLKVEAGAVGNQADIARRVIEGASSGLAKFNTGAEADSFTLAEQVGLESVILTDGSRPCLFVRNDVIDFTAPDIGDWGYGLKRVKDGLSRVAKSVGRINVPVDPYFAGTCCVIADGLVLTNRHVLEAIATLDNAGAWVLKWPQATFIDFNGEQSANGGTKFAIKRVRLAGPDAINRVVNFAHLDVAVLEVDPQSDPGHGFPNALTFDVNAARPTQGLDIYVLGFPGKPAIWHYDGTPLSGYETADVLNLLFDNRFGFKRLAPGKVSTGAGQLGDDPKKWIFAHDATTLGGNSGSCVVDLSGDGATVVGLHFAGVNRKQNWAHVAAKVQGFLRDSAVV